MNTAAVPSQVSNRDIRRRGLGSWSAFFSAVCDRPPSCLARLAMREVVFHGNALDLGAGAMNDSRFFLGEENLETAGFAKVIAVDASSSAGQFAKAVKNVHGARFDFIEARFGELAFPLESFDLIHSNFALPFNGPEGFDELIERIKSWLRPNGIFSCVFFGNKDEWSAHRRDLIKFTTREELDRLVQGLVVVPSQGIIEVENGAGLYNGVPKAWHYFRVIARKSDRDL